jgi:hypothetical protein
MVGVLQYTNIGVNVILFNLAREEDNLYIPGGRGGKVLLPEEDQLARRKC